MMDSPMLVAAAVGGIGAVGCAFADVVLLGKGSAGRAFFADPLGAMVGISKGRLLVGNVLGVLMLPLTIVGLYHVYRMIEPAGAWFALPPVFLLGWMLAVGTASHGTWGFMGALLNAKAGFAEGGAEEHRFTALIEECRKHWAILYRSSGMLFMAGGIWLVAAILIGPTHYPSWMAAMVPIILMVPLTLLSKLLPTPLGGLVAPAVFNLVWAAFLLVSAIIAAGSM